LAAGAEATRRVVGLVAVRAEDFATVKCPFLRTGDPG
jgi:hypothetical protein